MGKIDELINWLAHTKVQTVPLWSVTAWDKKFNAVDKAMQKKIVRYKYLLAKDLEKIVVPNGTIRILYTTKDVAYTTEKLASGYISEGEVVAIPWGGNPTVKYYKGKFVTGDNRIATALDKATLDNKYLFYWMDSKTKTLASFYRGAGIKHPSMVSVLTMEIPLPPLAVQKEIVEILDTFTGMIDNLQKELNQRQKQFEYYQEKILKFDDVIQQEEEVLIKKDGILGEIDELIKQFCPDGVQETLLGEIMTIVRGASPRPIKNYMSDKINGIPWIKIGDVNPNDKYIRNTAEYVTKEGAKKSRFLHKGDFILSNSMSFGRPYILGIDGCIHDGWIAMSGFEKDVCSKYLYYILRCDTTQKYWRMHANNGGAMTNLNADIVRGTPIPLPPLAVQEKIVEILDTFTGMIDNLHKEIELRQKQYEFYREKLLSFE